MSDKCVHTEHCCLQHGCKYGDYDCPVTSGIKIQSFDCEDCVEDKKDPMYIRITEQDATIAKLREAIQACVDDDFNSNALMIELTALVNPGM